MNRGERGGVTLRGPLPPSPVEFGVLIEFFNRCQLLGFANGGLGPTDPLRVDMMGIDGYWWILVDIGGWNRVLNQRQ